MYKACCAYHQQSNESSTAECELIYSTELIQCCRYRTRSLTSSSGVPRRRCPLPSSSRCPLSKQGAERALVQMYFRSTLWASINIHSASKPWPLSLLTTDSSRNLWLPLLSEFPVKAESKENIATARGSTGSWEEAVNSLGMGIRKQVVGS